MVDAVSSPKTAASSVGMIDEYSDSRESWGLRGKANGSTMEAETAVESDDEDAAIFLVVETLGQNSQLNRVTPAEG